MNTYDLKFEEYDGVLQAVCPASGNVLSAFSYQDLITFGFPLATFSFSDSVSPGLSHVRVRAGNDLEPIVVFQRGATPERPVWTISLFVVRQNENVPFSLMKNLSVEVFNFISLDAHVAEDIREVELYVDFTNPHFRFAGPRVLPEGWGSPFSSLDLVYNGDDEFLGFDWNGKLHTADSLEKIRLKDLISERLEADDYSVEMSLRRLIGEVSEVSEPESAVL